MTCHAKRIIITKIKLNFNHDYSPLFSVVFAAGLVVAGFAAVVLAAVAGFA
jgi:hypothetical protein